MSEVRTSENVYDEAGRIDKIFAEGIVIPKEPGHVQDGVSEEFMILSKMDESRGGFQLKLQYYEFGTQPNRPYVRWTVQDSKGNTDGITSINELASNQLFLEYNHVYWTCGYLHEGNIGLKVYELHEQGWQEVFSYHFPSPLNHIGANTQGVSVGGEIKKFFSERGSWLEEASEVPLLYRCSPASYAISNKQDHLALKNDLAKGVEDIALSDSKLSSTDSPFNESALNMGYGAFELRYTTDNAGNTLLFAPYLERHTPQVFTANEEMSTGTLPGAAVDFDGWPTDQGTVQKIGPGPFSKTRSAIVVEDLQGNPEQEPGISLDGQKKITVIGFYKPEVDVANDKTLDVNGHPLAANPCGLNPASLPVAQYAAMPGARYTPYGPQYYTVNNPMAPANIGCEFQDYPSFFLAAGTPSYDITAGVGWVPYRKNAGTYRTLWNGSSNTGMIGGTNADAETRYPAATYGALHDNFVTGGSWLGRYDINVWEEMRALGLVNNVTFLNDALRIAQDQAIWGARRFLVRGSFNNTWQQTAGNGFSSACWPFDRVRFGKMFRCCHDSTQFTPWLGQRAQNVLNNGNNQTPGWINVSRNSEEGALEGIPFLQYFRRPPVAGLMTCLITDMVPPSQTDPDTSSDEFPAPSLKAPGGPVSTFDFRKTAMAPSLCVTLRAKFDGSGVEDMGWDQVQGHHSVDPTPVGGNETQEAMSEIDTVYQVMQITGLPLQKIIPDQNDHANVWHMYVASIDTENQKAFIGCAPVPQYERRDLTNITNLAGWGVQQGTYVLGHDIAATIPAISPEPTETAGPDRNIIARVFRFGTEYDFSFCQPLNHPYAGAHRRRLLMASKDAVDYGLCIHAPAGTTETDELKAFVNEAIPMLDPIYDYQANAAEQIDVQENRIPDPETYPYISKFNMLGNIYSIITYNTMGNDRNGHDNMVFKGKVGEHMVVPGLYVNGDGQKLDGTNVPQYADYPAGPFNDLGLADTTDSVALADAFSEIQNKVQPPRNFRHISPNDRSAVCVVDAIRIHKQAIVDSAGDLLPGTCPASFPVLGVQPHYDLDTENVKLSEKATLHLLDEDGNIIDQVEP